MSSVFSKSIVSYPDDPPVINGSKLTEWWARGIADIVGGNGRATEYEMFVVDNGDKFFARTTTLAQSPGSGKLTTGGAGPITGGTGKLAGIQGMVRTSGTAEPKAGVVETQYEIEYWLEK